jgi:hypothetical protein
MMAMTDVPQRNFRFIFMKRSWAADRENLTKSLRELGARARSSGEKVEAASRRKAGTGSASHIPSVGEDGKDRTEATPLLANEQSGQGGRSPLWLLIFPEGTITSDEERVKSVRYAEREGIVSVILLLLAACMFPQEPKAWLNEVARPYHHAASPLNGSALLSADLATASAGSAIARRNDRVYWSAGWQVPARVVGSASPSIRTTLPPPWSLSMVSALTTQLRLGLDLFPGRTATQRACALALVRQPVRR